jgi:hypothetical protein
MGSVLHRRIDANAAHDLRSRLSRQGHACQRGATKAKEALLSKRLPHSAHQRFAAPPHRRSGPVNRFWTPLGAFPVSDASRAWIIAVIGKNPKV